MKVGTETVDGLESADRWTWARDPEQTERLKDAVSAVAAPRVAGRLLSAAARYLRAQGPQGNLLTSSGPLATQTVDIHVLPRGPDDALPADWPWMRTRE